MSPASQPPGVAEGSLAEPAIARPDKLVRKPARLRFVEGRGRPSPASPPSRQSAVPTSALTWLTTLELIPQSLLVNGLTVLRHERRGRLPQPPSSILIRSPGWLKHWRKSDSHRAGFDHPRICPSPRR